MRRNGEGNFGRLPQPNEGRGKSLQQAGGLPIEGPELARHLRRAQFARSVGELSDVDIDTNAPALNQGLVWNGENWVPGAGGGDITTSGLTMTTQRLLGNSDAAGGTGDIQEIVLASDNLTLSNGALQVVSIGPDVIDDAAITTEKLEDDAVTLDKVAFDIHDSVLLTHVTNTGSVTSVSLQQGGQALGENEVGVPVDRACTSNNAVVTWRAGTAPAGTWTLTLKKKAAGSRSYTTAATMTVNVNNG